MTDVDRELEVFADPFSDENEMQEAGSSLSAAYLDLCDELDRTREQLRDAIDALAAVNT